MTIETKFKPLDPIYFIANSKKVVNSMVRGVKIEITERDTKNVWDTEIVYLCNDKDDQRVYIKVSEKEAFATKQELLNSL